MANPRVRDLITELYEQRMVELGNRLASGAIDLGTFQITMRQELRDCFALQLRAGADAGGVTANDWLKLGPQLNSQYKYLEGFAHDIASGAIGPDAIAGRAMLYVRPSQQMYWRQKIADVELPAYPGDGTVCRCGCNWRTVRNADGSIDAYWERSLDDSCTTCIQRERDWNPYHVPALKMEAA